MASSGWQDPFVTHDPWAVSTVDTVAMKRKYEADEEADLMNPDHHGWRDYSKDKDDHCTSRWKTAVWKASGGDEFEGWSVMPQDGWGASSTTETWKGGAKETKETKDASMDWTWVTKNVGKRTEYACPDPHLLPSMMWKKKEQDWYKETTNYDDTKSEKENFTIAFFARYNQTSNGDPSTNEFWVKTMNGMA